jgi:hypothetical protein
MNKRNKIIICLSILIVVSIFIPLSVAIFKTTANTSGTLSTAAWDVSLNQTGINNNITLISGVDTQTFTLKVRSNSEVDAIYSIEVGNIPSGVEIKLDNGNFVTPTNNKITFTNAGTILYSSNNKENTHTLTFRSNIGTATVSNRSLTVDVIIEQEF